MHKVHNLKPHEVTIIMKFVNQLKDNGQRKVMILKLLHGKTDKEIGNVLGISTSAVERIGKAGALNVKRIMWVNMMRDKQTIGGNQ